MPADPSAPIKQVAAGQVDLAISYEPEVMLARDQGLDVVAVAALVHGPLTSLISLPEAGIEEPADLEGKTVVTAGIPYQTVYLETILRDAGVAPDDVEQVDVGLNLLQPRADRPRRRDARRLPQRRGRPARGGGQEPPRRPGRRARHPDLRRAGAGRRAPTGSPRTPTRSRRSSPRSREGTEQAAADPAAATDALLAAGEGLDPDLTRAQVDATLPLLQPPKGKPFGYMDPDEWEEFAAFLADQGQIGTQPSAADLLTDELLPER